MKNVQRKKGDEGFSLIELVIAVAILAILSIVGVVAYGQITKNSRQTAVDNAAAQVLKGAIAYKADGSKTPTDAETEWNNSADTERVSVDVQERGQCITVIATHAEGETATRKAGDSCDGTTPVEDDDNNSGTVEEARKYRINLEISTWSITDDDSNLDSVQVRFPLTNDTFTAPKVSDWEFGTHETFDIPGSSGITEEQLQNLGTDWDQSAVFFEQALDAYDRNQYSTPGQVGCSRDTSADTTEGNTEIIGYRCYIQSA